ncbi:MAG: penicillin-binding protein 2, partial [Phycisphaerales bacterium]|nr:penicillin-binding protein 2 [Phycisphaerales bacterium]
MTSRPDTDRGAHANDATDDLRERQLARVAAWSRALFLCVLAVFIVVIGRVVQLKVAPDPRLAPAAGAVETTRTEIARRGDLLDRRGRVLATSTIQYRLFVDPQSVTDLDTIALDLADLLDLDPVAVDRAIQRRADTSRFIIVHDALQEWQVQRFRAHRIAGVGLEPRLARHYPLGHVGEQLIGLVGFEHEGLGGLEYTFQASMTPRDGSLRFLRDVRRRPLWIESKGFAPAQDGQDVTLSIDMVVQEIAERNLRGAVESHNAGGGRLVVLDCQSGEILAMADIVRRPVGREAILSDPARSIHPALGRNRCATDTYEPGSTFKPFIWAVATELKRVTPEEHLPTPDGTSGPYRTSRGRAIRDTAYLGDATWRMVLIRSLNSGMAIVGERLTPKEMREAIAGFGFGMKTDCGVPGESAGLVTSARRWTHHTQTSVPMGHEIAITPLQMARAFSAFARDGSLPMVRITAMDDADERFTFRCQAIEPATARLTRSVLREVMTEGTGRRAQSQRYRLFGKSGTPQMPKANGGG